MGSLVRNKKTDCSGLLRTPATARHRGTKPLNSAKRDRRASKGNAPLLTAVSARLLRPRSCAHLRTRSNEPGGKGKNSSSAMTWQVSTSPPASPAAPSPSPLDRRASRALRMPLSSACSEMSHCVKCSTPPTPPLPFSPGCYFMIVIRDKKGRGVEESGESVRGGGGSCAHDNACNSHALGGMPGVGAGAG